MIALYIGLGLISLLILALIFLRAGIMLVYAQGGLKAWIQIWFVKIMLYPEKKDRAYISTEKTDKAAPDKEKGGSYEQATKGLPIIKDILGKLRHKLIIDELVIRFLAAGEDPAATAVGFGAASAGAGILLALINNHFDVRKQDIRTNVSFTDKKPSIYIKARASVYLRELRFLFSKDFLSALKQGKDKGIS